MTRRMKTRCIFQEWPAGRAGRDWNVFFTPYQPW